MKYKDVKTPIQLLKYMEENIKYGFVDDNGKQYTPINIEEFQEACKTKYKLSSPTKTSRSKIWTLLGFCRIRKRVV